MALTRGMLKSMTLTDEQISAIIEAHMETVEGLKKERDAFRTSAEAAEEVAKERDSLKAQLEKAGDAAKVQADFDAYKQQVEQDKMRGRKAAALDKLLKDAGVVKDSFRATLGRTWDMDKIELDDAGGIKDAAALTETVKRDYGDFIATTTTTGTSPVTPPQGGGTKLTKEQIAAISDKAERRAAIAANLELFE